MAQVTDPIILDSTGQAIKNSIDLLTANINRTASNIPYDSNLTIKGKIDEIDAKTASDVPYDSNTSVQEAIDEISNQQDKDLIASTKAWPGASLIFSDIESSNSQVYKLTAIESGSATNFIDYYVVIRTNNVAYASKISGQNATFTYNGTAKTLTVTLPSNAYYIYSFKKIKSNY